MQSDIWAEFKEKNGWNVHKVKGLYVYEHSLPLSRNFLYLPEISIDDETFPATVAIAQGALSSTKNIYTIFGRAELLEPFNESKDQKIVEAGFVKSNDEVQPAYRHVINLGDSYKEVVNQYKSKCRYKIRVAERHGVVIDEDNTTEAISEFNEINADTAKRKGFSGRNARYIIELVKTLDKHKIGGLWVARYRAKIVAGAVIIFYAGRASYLYGASSDENREVMATRLLHDKMIKESIRRKCSQYDFIGVAPEDAPMSHPWAGISAFKRDFGGTTVHYLGSYDRVYQGLWYKAYKTLRKSN